MLLGYQAELLSVSEYYPFGMEMPGRIASSEDYRYGFNGKEKDDEVKGSGAQYDYGFRVYDARLGRFLSVDPLTMDYPMLTPYQFTSNTPIMAIDLDGLEAFVVIKGEGGEFTKIQITKSGTLSPTQAYNAALLNGTIPQSFHNGLVNASNGRFQESAGTLNTYDVVPGIRYWLKGAPDKYGNPTTETYFGVFEDKEFSQKSTELIDGADARSLYDANHSEFGKSVERYSLEIKINAEAITKRLPGENAKNAIKDLSTFNGLKVGRGKIINLIAFRKSAFSENSKYNTQKLLEHEILSHLSVPQAVKQSGRTLTPNTLSTDFHHDESINAGVPVLNLEKDKDGAKDNN